mmetsp:Transcript_24747/g.53385  ORF Transcript_24747/g.53385 Transcript_24747/m.53385 type:complete len:671 (+) Transcript_24747:351-2363(+)
MAWNGKNVSILGAKAGATDAAPADVPSKQAEGTSSSSNNQASKNEQAAEPKKMAPPAPSVWNGRHAKIIVSTPEENIPATSSSDATSGISKKEVINNVKVVSLSPKDDGKNAAKEDETATNSTAGSSSTITTVNEARDPPTMLEGNTVVTTNTVKSSDSKKDGSNDNSNSSSSDEKNTNVAASTPAPTLRSGANNNINSNRHTHHARNASDVNASNNSRRSGNYKAGLRNNNGNNHSHPGKQNYSRSNPNNGSSVRRRVYNGEKPVCSFFLRGMCNRGTSCAFKHDMANADNTTMASAPPSSICEVAPLRSSPLPAANMNFAATTFVPANKRVFDPHKARAIQLAKEAQDQEDRSKFVCTATRIPEEADEKKEEETEDAPIFSIDVECIATGYGSCANGINDGCGNAGGKDSGVPSTQYNDRSHRYPGRIAIVDSEGKVLADITVRPPNDGAGVTSYLTPLTGLTAEMCFGDDAVSLEEAVAQIKELLPKNGVLVGQAIDHDVEWLGLTPGVDFERMVDISDIFRQRMPAGLREAAEALKKKEEGGDAEQQPTSDDKSTDAHLGFPTYYRHFSLRHVSLNLLSVDIQAGVHNPITDAQYSLLLFHKYRNSSVTQLRIVRDGLHRAPITPGFAQENGPVIDGVCLSGAGYPYKRAARMIWRWYQTTKKQQS